MKERLWLKRMWLIVLPLILLALNIWLIFPLFQGGYTQYMGSIECQFLTQAKFITDNFPHLSWVPFWYNGFPYHNIYLPIIGFTLALIKSITQLSLSDIYRISTAILYALSPVTLFFLINYLTKRKLIAFVSALIYSFVPSAVYLIEGIRNIGLEYNFIPWRLAVLTLYGEGSHIWGLAIFPLALLYFIRLLREPSKLNWILAVVFNLIVLLTSLTAFLPLMVLSFIFLVAELSKGEAKRKFYNFLGFLILTFGLSAFWFNLSFSKAIFGFTGSLAGSLFTGIYGNPSLIIFLFIILISIFIIFIIPLFKKFKYFYLWFVGLGSFILFFATLHLRYNYEFALIPLPFNYLSRVGPEVELTFALFMAIFLLVLSQYLSRIWKYLSLIFVPGLIILLLIWLPFKTEGFREVTKPNSDITATTEYQITDWLSSNANGKRVYLTGTHTFWLNVWSDVFQLRGAGDHATQPLWPHLWYQIYWGDDGKLAIKWLQALGIKYIVVNFPESKVTFHDYRYPYKFDGLAEKVFEYQGDVIYALPVQHTGLVAAVDKQKLDKVGIFWDIKEGKEILNEEKLNQYLDATENSPEFFDLNYSYQSPWKEMEIKAPKIKEGQGVLVRMSYHPGWQAYQNNQKIKIKKDPLGFMLLEANQGENQNIILKFKPTFDVYLGYIITFLTLFIFIIFLKNFRGKQSDQGEEKERIKSENEN
jgi:hypothetical protein